MFIAGLIDIARSLGDFAVEHHIGGAIAVMCIGGSVSVAELASRYLDAAGHVLTMPYSRFHIALNVFAALIAYVIVIISDWKFNVSSTAAPVLQVLISGFGSMAIFRTSMMSIRKGTSDIDLGPSEVLRIILSSVNRAVDRKRAEERLKLIGEAMKGVNFEKAATNLPGLLAEYMRSITLDEQNTLSNKIEEIRRSQIDGTTKSQRLGGALLDLCGDDLFKSLIGQARTVIEENNMQQIPNPIAVGDATPR